MPNGVRRLFRLPQSRARLLREMDDEMRFHLEMRIADLRKQGLSETDAEREALRRFGDSDELRASSADHVTRRARAHAIVEWLTEWTQDVRFAARQFARAPGFTLVAVLTLALGIGANTAIFSVVHHLLIAPLPYPNGNRIVMPTTEDERGMRFQASLPVIHAWHTRGHSIDLIAAAEYGNFDVRPDGTVDSITYAQITSNFLQVLGVHPALGRAFTPEEERGGKAAVAMISYGSWQRAFGGRADALGKRVQFDNKAWTIIGVTPPRTSLPTLQGAAPDLWMPMALDEDDTSDRRMAPQTFVTLRDGVSAATASHELESIAASVPDPRSRGTTRTRAMRAQDFLDDNETRGVQVLFVAVGALLLIACANVANLLLARAWTRRREFAVRVALGAGRGRLARQVLTESALLALAGGVLGVVIAWQTLRIIVSLRPPSLEHLVDVRIEPAVLLWSAVISVATGILFGTAPALFAGARSPGDMLRSESRTGTGGMTSRRVRSALVVLEIATSLVLLVGAGLLVRSFVELQGMPLGFEPRGLVYQDVLMGGRHNRGRQPMLRAAVLDRLRSLPGVTEVAVGTMPGKGYGGGGLETAPDRDGHSVRMPALGTTFITPNYFRVAHIALFEGRPPDSSATNTGWLGGRPALSPEVVVNRSLARRLWPAGHAVGSRVRTPPGGLGPRGDFVEPWVTVVGVVDDIHMPGPYGDGRALQVYSLLPPQMGNVPFLVRTAQSGEDAATTIHRAVVAVDRGLLVRPPVAGEAYLRDGLAPTRFAMALLTAFAIIALVLSAVGLYGVIAYSVTQRTREIGVRVAMGAAPRAVAGMVVGDALRLAAVGVVLGAFASMACTRVLGSLLYGVSPADPLTFAIIALLVVAIALLASYVPVRRALRIDPAEALRVD